VTLISPSGIETLFHTPPVAFLSTTSFFRRLERRLAVCPAQGLSSLFLSYLNAGEYSDEDTRRVEVQNLNLLLGATTSLPSPSGADSSLRLDNLIYLVVVEAGISLHKLEHIFSVCTRLKGFSGFIDRSMTHTGFDSIRNDPESSLPMTGRALEENNKALKVAFAKAKNLQEANITILSDLISVLEALAHVKYIKVMCNIGPPMESPKEAPPCQTEVLYLNFYKVREAHVRTVIGTVQHMVRASCVIKSPPPDEHAPRENRWWTFFDHTLKRLADIAYDNGPRFSPLPKEVEHDSQPLDQNLLDITTA